VGYGLKETDEGGLSDEESIVVFVEKKLPEAQLSEDEIIPKEVDIQGTRVRTDVRTSGIVELEQEQLPPRRRERGVEEPVTKRETPQDRIRPIVGGVSCGHAASGATGTLGSSPLRTDDGSLVCVTNSHVAAESGDAEPGDAIIQPGAEDGGQQPEDVIGHLSEFTEISIEEPNTCDSALVEVSKQTVDDAIFSFDDPLRGWTKPRLGRPYQKCGRTTGLTQGRLIARDVEFNIGYEDGVATFRGLDAYEPMSLRGDSGSLIVDERGDGLYGTSLLFAGSERLSLGIPMEEVQAVHGELTPLSAKEELKPSEDMWTSPWSRFRDVAGAQLPILSDGRETTGSFTRHTFVNDEGEELAYRKFVPSGYEEAGEEVPLLVMLHGCTQSPETFAQETKGNCLAEEETCIALYPDQARDMGFFAQEQQAETSNPGQLPGQLPGYGAGSTLDFGNPMECWSWWSDEESGRGQGEASLIAGMTRQVIAQHNIDSERVYIAGFSAGGGMTSNLIVAYPELFAAACIHSGLQYDAAESRIDAYEAMGPGGPDPIEKGEQAYENMGDRARVVPTIVFHGTNDTIVHPHNSAKIIKQIAQMNDLADDGRDNDSIDHSPEKVSAGNSAGRRYEHEEYHDDEGNVVMERYLVEGMPHAWSGGSEGGQYTDPSGPDATERMWEFFERQHLGKAPVADASTIVTEAGSPVQFYGGGSYDEDGRIMSHEWSFENGQTKLGEQVSYTFQDPGTYEVTLKVVDNEGNVGTDTRTVKVTGS
jgi:poly(hydroxyalkanoate) depolymerase family esterase